MYSRTVLHQSGWRQLPNYELWQGLFGFIGDMVVIVILTVVDKVNILLRLVGMKKAQAFDTTHAYGGQYDAERRVDADNQLIDDIEDDRW